MEPMTLWFMGQWSNQLSHTTQGLRKSFLKELVFDLDLIRIDRCLNHSDHTQLKILSTYHVLKIRAFYVLEIFVFLKDKWFWNEWGKWRNILHTFTSLPAHSTLKIFMQCWLLRLEDSNTFSWAEFSKFFICIYWTNTMIFSKHIISIPYCWVMMGWSLRSSLHSYMAATLLYAVVFPRKEQFKWSFGRFQASK